ncbi:CBS domain-containing protein [Alkalinema sp. FACHB-956]|uniref:CBS domain-containing protein n=1 Tax=Alkalinema sp. FACHB-956 TaxID=2692768 RepID=UPI001688B4F1|nr:CBS domain-containing protein [Alkalinema sp. FACHB-956]MBD2329802.1 CBS domain-containing protein [Alkalinema sp. FACHB-956]
MFIDTTTLSSAELKSAIVRAPLELSPEATVMAAIGEMSGVRTMCATAKSINHTVDELHLEARSSCVLVVEDKKLLGILTERDVVRLTAQQQSIETLTLREAMTTDVITLQESAFTDLFSAVNLLQQHHIRHLPVLDDQHHLVGLLTHESLRQTSRPIDLLRLRLVAEVMTTDVVCAAPESSMLEIACLMTQHRVSSVVITQLQRSQHQMTGQRAIGIVTERDLVQFQAVGLSLDNCTAGMVMSTPLFSVHPEDSLWVVQHLMEKHLIRRLAVTDDQECLLGIVTQSSLLQALNPLELYKLAEVLEKKVLQLEAEKIELLQHRTLELEMQVAERTAALQAKVEQEQLIATISSQIRSSLNLSEILKTTVDKLRLLFRCDHVAVWKFQPDWSTVVVSEASAQEEKMFLGFQATDHCFATDWLEAYRNGRVRVVEDIYQAEMTDCHRELLESLNIRAKVLVPITQGPLLWGLLTVIETQHPRQWQSDEIILLQQLANQIAIAIQQANTYEQMQMELVERKQVEIQLRESEQRYATLAAAVPVGIFRTDAQGKSIYINQRCCEMIGLRAEETFGDNWQRYLHPDDARKVGQEAIASRQEGRPFRLEYRCLHPDGRLIWVFGQAVAEYDTQGNIIGYVGTLTDITDRKQAELALQQLNQNLEVIVEQRTNELRQSNVQLSNVNAELARATRLKDEFLANMSHELRTPLNAILGLSEALQDEILGDLNDRQQRSIATIAKSGRHLLELINDILDLSKISAGKLDLDVTSISIRLLCEGSLVFVKQQAHQKQIRLASEVPDDLGNIMADERRIRQVLINLLTNAVKFTPSGGQVTLRVAVYAGQSNLGHLEPASIGNIHLPQPFLKRLQDSLRQTASKELPRPEQSWILFQVQDTGIGIAPEDLARLFQPFVQVDTSLNRQQTGTGLGLALVKQIAELHSGMVYVDSQPEQGSYFTVVLPYQMPTIEAVPPREVAPADGMEGEPMAGAQNTVFPLILLAEDNEDNIETFSAYLLARGYRLMLAGNGEEAVTLAQRHRPDLILMDIQMPRVDGLTAIRRLRADSSLADIPIIALTALAMQGDAERCLAAGANDYLSKPVRLKQLLDVMQQLLSPDRSIAPEII